MGGAIGYLAYLGGVSSWQYYVTVDEAVGDAERLEGTRVRVSGCVAIGSLEIGKDRRRAKLQLEGKSRVLDAVCRCSIPDNLAEDVEVVVEGTLQEGCLHGHKVITRCASKYEAAGGDMVTPSLRSDGDGSRVASSVEVDSRK
jgi:cytochrome c-type biogenesis protein CcmE